MRRALAYESQVKASKTPLVSVDSILRFFAPMLRSTILQNTIEPSLDSAPYAREFGP